MRSNIGLIVALILGGCAVDVAFVTTTGADWRNPYFLIGALALFIGLVLLLDLGGRELRGRARKAWQLRHGGWTSPEPIRDELPSRVVAMSPPSPPRISLLTPVCNTPGYEVWNFGDHEKKWPAQWRFHISEGNNGVLMECRAGGTEIPASVNCEVEDPQGKRHRATLHHNDGSVRCAYPLDFGVEAESGGHHVHWTALGQEMGFKEEERQPMYEVLDFAIRVEPRG